MVITKTRRIGGRRVRLGMGPASGILVVVAIFVAASLTSAAPASAAFGYLGKIGSAGLGAGQFFDPYGLDAGPGGDLYVADTGNFRIQRLHADGTSFNPPVMWGSHGTGNGQFSKPYDIAVDGSGNVYVADGWRGGPEIPNERVQKFDANGSFLKTWGSSGAGDGQFQGLNGIAAYTDTSVVPAATYVYTTDNDRVQKFDADGNFLGKWGSPGFGPGQFRDLWDVVTDSAGNVYTVESDGGGPGGNHRVQKFDKDGAFLAQFDIQSDGECWRRLAVDNGGFVYVVPECRGGAARLKRFSPAGELVDTLVCPGSAGGFVGADRAGKVYLGAQNNGLFVFGDGGGACPTDTPPGGGGGGDTGGAVGLAFNGAEGVTINAGAQFTNDTSVELSIVHPGGTTEVRIANDGGFLVATTRAPDPTGRYPWLLETSGPERLPKTVYVRFTGPGGQSPLTFSDDIILDETPPQISQASLSGGGERASRSASASTVRRYTLRVRASDNVSGVARLQLATEKRRPAKPQPFKRKLTLRAAKAPRYVRVTDRAGNFSKWRKLKRLRALKAPTPSG